MLSWAICFSSPSNAQQVDTTGNLINNNVDYSGQTGWSGIGAYSQIQEQLPGNIWGCCYSFNSMPFFDASTGGNNGLSGQIHWSYGQSTVYQNIGVNQALSGIGLQVTGYMWGYDIRNMNGTGGQAGVDTITATSYLRNSAGQTILSESHTYNTAMEWTRFTGYQTLPAPLSTSNLSVLGISFTSIDSGYWAGYYGPQVRNVDLRLNYMSDRCSVDPLYSTTCPGYAEAFFNQQCALNPLYNQMCPGYTAVILSDNLVPNPGGQTGFFGGFLNNSFAINTALSHSGAGLMVHGFQWGYRATNYTIFGSALGESTVNVNIRNGDGTSLYAWSRNNTRGGENSYSASYVLPQSINNLNMGNFDFTATSSGFGNVDKMWAKAFITPDSCTVDPLSSPLCTKYQEAFLAQQCSIYTLYSPQCPGYAEAMQTLLNEQAALAASTTSSSTASNTETTGSTDNAVLSSSTDTTSSPAAVTTDAGGVDVSTTGEIKAQDGIPEAVKETKTVEKTSDEKIAVETTNKTEKEKKTLSTSQLLAIARKAADDREARAIAEKAEKESTSESANPSDGTGTSVASLGTGISLPGFSMKFGSSSENIEKNEVSTSNSTSTISSVTAVAKTNQSNSQDDRQQSNSSVKKNVQPNKLAGDETALVALTQPPADFSAYLTSQLKDAQFYQSKEIYKGQKTVDNVRLLRGLSGSSDKKYEEMINGQYR